MLTLPPALISRLLTSKARRCPRCGGAEFRVTPSGALACCVCSPGESVAVFVADVTASGLLAWRERSEFDDQQSPHETTESFPAAGWGAGGLAAGVSGGPWLATPEPFAAGLGNRIDPEPKSPPERILCVSTSLEWGWWTAADLPAVDVPAWRWGNLDHGAGLFQRLSQPVFAWLCFRVESLFGIGGRRDESGRPLGVADLQSLAVAAMDGGLFGEWAANDLLWPRLPPPGFTGPVAADCPVWWLCAEIGQWPWVPMGALGDVINA